MKVVFKSNPEAYTHPISGSFWVFEDNFEILGLIGKNKKISYLSTPVTCGNTYICLTDISVAGSSRRVSKDDIWRF